MTKLWLRVLLLFRLAQGLEAWEKNEVLSTPWDNEEIPRRIGPWDDEDSPRKIDNSCECGLEKNSTRGYKPWQMFVIGSLQGTLYCTGTIIASNLLVTAHNCLQKVDSTYNVYDAWFPSFKSKNVYNKSSFVISKWSDRLQSYYKIVNVIYNHRYGVHLATNNHPIDNLVIFQVAPEFTKDPELGPVCLPEATDQAKDLIGKSAYFYGFGVTTGRSRRSKPWDFVERCLYPYTTTTPSTTTKTPTPSTTTARTTISASSTPTTLEPDLIFEPSAPPPPPVDLYLTRGEIVDENVCSREILSIENQLLCFRRHGKKLIPRWGDGALFVESGSKHMRHFLVGTAATRPSSRDDTLEYLNFSKVPGLVRYIEYHSARAGSQWCHSVKMEPLRASKGNPRNEWEKPGADLTRVETLDCGCGIKNFESHRTKRVVFGGEAKPQEFPWMVYIQSRLPWGFRICAGTIINDLAILSTADCFGKVQQVNDLPIVLVDVEIIQLYVRGHARGDSKADRPKAAYLYHYPDFNQHDRFPEYSKNIALVILKEPLKFTGCQDGLRPICIPTSPIKANLGGKLADFAGWGVASEFPTGEPDFGLAHVLQKGMNRILNDDVCQRTLPQREGIHRIRSLCTMHVDGYADYKSGEAGAPLMIPEKKSLYTQYTNYGIYIIDSTHKTNGKENMTYFNDLRDHLRFIEYYSKKHGARWCRPIVKD